MPSARRSVLFLAFAAILVGAPLAGGLVSAQERNDGIGGIIKDLFGDGASRNNGDAAKPAEPPQPVSPAPRAAVPASREQMQLSFAPLVKQTAPAVVNVYAERMVQSRSPFAGDPFFERFFGQRMPNRTERQSSLGSGVVVDPSGIVVTNNHVIEGADQIRVAFADGREFASRILLKDETVDLAILKIDADTPFETVPLGDSDAVEVGDLVLAIGNPFGVGQTVTSGIVSALARNQVGVSDFGFFIQTDAAINPGNSGGALVDMDGRLIGINTAIFSRSGGSIGIGFAIPANMVRAVAMAAESGGDTFVRPYIGATFEPVTAEIAEALGVNQVRGALVSSVVNDGPAAKAGLVPGDIVTALNDRPVEHPDALGYRLATAGIGSTAVLDVLSRGERRQIEIAMEAAPEGAAEITIQGDSPFAGAVVADLSPALADRMRLRPDAGRVVVTDVDERSPAARFGLRPRDVVVAVNGEDMMTAAQLDETMQEGGGGLWRFDIDRDGQLLRQFVR